MSYLLKSIASKAYDLLKPTDQKKKSVSKQN